MDDEEAIVVAACSAVSQAVALYAQCCDSGPRSDKKNILTVTSLHFEPMLRSAAHLSWFESNLRCAKTTFLRITTFLQEHGVRLALAKVKQQSYEKKVAAALSSLGSPGGYREVGAAMGMSRSYVMEITTEVVRVLVKTAPSVVCFPRGRKNCEAVEAGFAARHGYPGVVGAVDGSLIAIERPDNYDGIYYRKCYPALNFQGVWRDNLHFPPQQALQCI